MTLGQALALVNQRKQVGQRRKIFLVCGFQPLHLGTFLQGHFASRFSNEAADIRTGLYGDLEQTLISAAASRAEAAMVVIEWSDLDARLGLRSTGGWAVSVQGDILESCQERLSRILESLRELAGKMPVAIVMATLPIRLLGSTAGWQLSATEAELHKQAATFLAEAAKIGGVAILNSARLAQFSPEQQRLDALMELRTGFPYTMAHASAAAGEAVKLLFPPGPMKGLITDLDETLWSGIVGEVGTQGVTWSLADHTHIHGLYQQMLGHLSEMGVLLAIASKNELAVVEQALERDDLLIPAKSFFPICASWTSKSDSIAGILQTWNIGADSVVFVDDSPMELDEVRTKFPAMKCLQFPSNQPAKAIELFEQLRDLFGKTAIHREDTLRQSSIRANAAVRAAGASPNGQFVRSLNGVLTFDCRKDPSNKRLLELINKTNQFNLNGVRIGEGEWLNQLKDENAVIIGVSYEDKFGPLGTIGVLSGRQIDGAFVLNSWVLSCRAFSRQIEDHMLDHLFNQHGAAAIQLAFRTTDRNQPLRNYIASLGLDLDSEAGTSLSRAQFQNRFEALPHQIRLQN